MNSANTKKSELRAIAQVSGMMKGMIEGNDKSKARFDFESILPLYNDGNPLQTRAAYSNDIGVTQLNLQLVDFVQLAVYATKIQLTVIIEFQISTA